MAGPAKGHRVRGGDRGHQTGSKRYSNHSLCNWFTFFVLKASWGQESACSPGGTSISGRMMLGLAWGWCLHNFTPCQLFGMSEFLPDGYAGGERKGHASCGRASWLALCPRG